MIISKTPVRISIGGGGTDLPSYYSRFGSDFISAAINKYIYIIIQERKHYDEFLIKYSQSETVKDISQIKNEIVRECLKFLNISQPLEIVSISDVGGQSGLGSSKAFTVGLLNALHVYKREVVSQQQLAEEAFHITVNILKEPSGKQDEYISAFGGFTFFQIDKNGLVTVNKNEFNEDFVRGLEHDLYIFYTGINRESKEILSIQHQATQQNDAEMIKNLKGVHKLGLEIKEALNIYDGQKFGHLLHKHWLLKRKRAKTTNNQIDEWYKIAKKNGAIGGKIMGAGGGGFFLFHCPSNGRILISKLTDHGLKHIPFHFDYIGSKVIADF